MFLAGVMSARLLISRNEATPHWLRSEAKTSPGPRKDRTKPRTTQDLPLVFVLIIIVAIISNFSLQNSKVEDYQSSVCKCQT